LKLVEERARHTLEAIGRARPLYNSSGSATKRKHWQMRLPEIKIFCITKELVSVLKRPLIEWEKIFVSYTSDKVLITEYT
jgi:hypothetical protein